MSNSIISFAFETQTVRTATNLQDNSIWFCLPDVANVLEISRSSDLLQIQKDFVKNETPSSDLLQVEKPAFVKNETSSKRGALDPKGCNKIAIPTNGGTQQITFINEPNLYRVIFRSNKPEAVKFQNWVFDEVLPTLRKTGSYHTPEPATPTPQPQSPKLSQSDYNVLRRVVRLISDSMHYQGGATTAIYARLRTLCEVDSISDIRYQHLNIIRNELCRIERCLRTYTRHRREVEINLIRGICLGNDDSVWEAIKAIEKDSSVYIHQLNDSIDTFITLKEFKKIGSMS